MKKCTRCGIEKNFSEFSKRGEKYRSWCKSCEGAEKRKWYSSNRDKALEYWKKHKYGVTLIDYEFMNSIQNGKCATCGKEKKLVIDHNHKNGEVRGLLCHQCNTAMGLIQDNAITLKMMINYLDDYPAKKISVKIQE